MKRSDKVKRWIAAILGIVMLVLDVFAINMLVDVGLFPRIFIIGIGVLMLLALMICVLMIRFSSKWIYWLFATVILFSIARVLILCNHMRLTRETLETNLDVKTFTTRMSVYVNSEDAAQTIEEIADYNFGILEYLDRENTDQTVAEINEALHIQIKTKEYEDIFSLAEAMVGGKVQAIIVNEAYLGILEDVAEEEDIASLTGFSARVRILADYYIERAVKEQKDIEDDSSSKKGNEEPPENAGEENPGETLAENGKESTVETQTKNGKEGSKKTNVRVIEKLEPIEYIYKDTDSIVVYISGQDAWGGISVNSRSDVNILAVINNRTKNVLLVSTPRDMYLPSTVADGCMEKLTHAGIYGIDSSIDSLERLYTVDIDYYFKLNFSGFEAIIDALGGITVWSDYDFTVEPIKHYVKGDNELTGLEALAFARERHSFAAGDNVRGRNQMNVIISLIDKLSSKALLENYYGVIRSLDGLFLSNIPYDVISSLVQDQLNSGAQWNISTYAATGQGARDICYSSGSKAVYVMYPNENSIEEAKEKIREIMSTGNELAP